MSARARVRLTVDVAIESTWGDECGLGQVFSQAADEAVGLIRQIDGERRYAGRLTVIGEPIVEAVILPKETRT